MFFYSFDFSSKVTIKGLVKTDKGVFWFPFSSKLSFESHFSNARLRPDVQSLSTKLRTENRKVRKTRHVGREKKERKMA